MTASPYPNLAKEFMNLWQQQIASLVSDKDFIQAMLAAVESMKMPHVTPSKPSNSTDAFGTDSGNSAQLAYRLAMCERRIAALEKEMGQQASSPKAARKPTRRSTKKK